MPGDLIGEQGTVEMTSITDVAQGRIVVTNGRVALASRGLKANTPGVVHTKGVFDYTAASGVTWNDGALLYWIAGSDELTNSASGNTLCGRAVGGKATGVTRARFDLNAT